MVRGVSCHPDDEEKFLKWFDEFHLPLLFKYEGLTSITRGNLQYDDAKVPKFFALFTFKDKQAWEGYAKSKEFAEAKADSEKTWKERPFISFWRVPYEVTRTWTR